MHTKTVTLATLGTYLHVATSVIFLENKFRQIKMFNNIEGLNVECSC